MEDFKKTTNSSYYKKLLRRNLEKSEGLCPVCPLQGGENSKRKGRHGVKKPKYKDKARGSKDK